MRKILYLLIPGLSILGLGFDLSILTAQGTAPITETYGPAASKLIAAALADDDGYKKLEYLTTRIGNRLSGSATLDTAIHWFADTMKADGLENVRIQPVKVPHWVRGRESASFLSPIQAPLTVLALGNSLGGPAEGITAEVVMVHSLEEMDQLGREKLQGRIVFLNHNWPGVDERARYGATSPLRTRGASRAAKYGAKAFLIRSLTGVDLKVPHTGAMNYEDGIEKIPAAALTLPDADRIAQFLKSGKKVEIHLELVGHHFEPDADSGNVMGEIRGRELPNEVVVLGGHIDSWDVGQGAQDDGSGIVAAWQAVELIKKLGLKPRRTIRVAGWTNEENGGRGGRAYAAEFAKQTVAAFEMDGGAERPSGFNLAIGKAPTTSPAYINALGIMDQINRLLHTSSDMKIEAGGGGSDTQELANANVPTLGLYTVRKHYFDWHHTAADTIDKVDKKDFRRCIAALAVASYILADMPGHLGDAAH